MSKKRRLEEQAAATPSKKRQSVASAASAASAHAPPSKSTLPRQDFDIPQTLGPLSHSPGSSRKSHADPRTPKPRSHPVLGSPLQPHADLRTPRGRSQLDQTSLFNPPSLSRSVSSPGRLQCQKIRQTPTAQAQNLRSALQQASLEVDDDEMEDLISDTEEQTSGVFNLEESHDASTAWYAVYEKYPLGSLPDQDICQDAPYDQRDLAHIPIRKSVRQNSILGHFYGSATSPGVDMHECKVTGEDGIICGQRFSKKSGGRSRTRHIKNYHKGLLEALRLFRFYQAKVKGIALPNEDDGTEDGPTKAFDAVREQLLLDQLSKPMEREVNRFHQRIIDLVVQQGVPIRFLESAALKNLVSFLHPYYKVPGRDKLQEILSERVANQKRWVKNYLSKQGHRGSITLDSWTSRDQRKYLGVTYHFFSTSKEMASVIIGMERIKGPQDAPAVKRAVRKLAWAVLTMFACCDIALF